MNLELTPHLERLHALGLSVTQAADWLELPTPKPLLTALKEEELPYWTDICLDAMEEAFEEDPETFTSYTLGSRLTGDTWTAKTARAALPVLIERAESGEGPLTYTELDNELARRHPDRPPSGRMTKYAYPLGSIGSTIDAIRREAQDATSEVRKRYAELGVPICIADQASLEGAPVPEALKPPHIFTKKRAAPFLFISSISSCTTYLFKNNELPGLK